MRRRTTCEDYPLHTSLVSKLVSVSMNSATASSASAPSEADEKILDHLQHPSIPPKALRWDIETASDRASFVVGTADINDQHASNSHRQHHQCSSLRHDISHQARSWERLVPWRLLGIHGSWSWSMQVPVSKDKKGSCMQWILRSSCTKLDSVSSQYGYACQTGPSVSCCIKGLVFPAATIFPYQLPPHLRSS